MDITKKWTAPLQNWPKILNQLAIRFEGPVSSVTNLFTHLHNLLDTTFSTLIRVPEMMLFKQRST